MNSDAKCQWHYQKQRSKPSFSPPGPASSGVSTRELQRLRSQRYRQRLSERGLKEIRILVPQAVASRLEAIASKNGQHLAEFTAGHLENITLQPN